MKCSSAYFIAVFSSVPFSYIPGLHFSKLCVHSVDAFNGYLTALVTPAMSFGQESNKY